MAYHSAYIGIVPGPNGEFDHFLRQVDPSHLNGGYWRFQSIEDDRRAMARGFTTPEDVLQAADSSDDNFDEIMIRWVRGTNDASFTMALSGRASQHLQTIYELRSLLHLPMSSRGQVPLYPISTNPRLKQYWDAKYRAQRTKPIDPALELPERPISSPVSPGPVRSTSPHARNATPATPKSPVGRIMRARSAKLPQPARPKPAAKAIPLQQKTPSAPKARATEPTAASPLSERTIPPRPPIDTIGQRQVLSQSTLGPASTFAPQASSGSQNVPLIPRAALEWGLQSSPQQAPSHIGNGVSQHTWVHPSARNSGMRYSPYATPPQQQNQPNGISYPRPEPSASITRPIAPSNIPSRVPTSGIQGRRFTERHTGEAIPRQGDDDPAVSTITFRPANKQSSPAAAPTNLSAFSDNAGIIGLPKDPRAPRHATPETPTRERQELSFGNLSSPVAPPISSPAPRAEVVTNGEPARTAEASRPTAGGMTPVPRDNEVLPTDDSRSHSISDTLRMDTKTAVAVKKAVETTPEPWGSYMKELEQFPCVDCGEDDGHRWDCNLGNIQPMQNLTVLDYRNLADAVERFDPGPWTTHHIPPEPEPEVEDAETQIRGMAEVIRNEDSYNQDPELHSLPDHLMMILWAFKTLENVQVVNEYYWDSGIDESDMG